jgi:mono/diheme cytochrome c family protein
MAASLLSGQSMKNHGKENRYAEASLFMNSYSVKFLGCVASFTLGVGFSVAHAADDGAALYKSAGCASCHGANGEGIPGLAPPLKGNPAVTGGDAQALTKTILQGRNAGDKKYKEYQGIMPAHSFLRGEKADALIKYLKQQLQQ